MLRTADSILSDMWANGVDAEFGINDQNHGSPGRTRQSHDFTHEDVVSMACPFPSEVRLRTL